MFVCSFIKQHTQIVLTHAFIIKHKKKAIAELMETNISEVKTLQEPYASRMRHNL